MTHPAPIRFPWDEAPVPGQAVEIAPGVLWMRMPLPMALNHVNVYALDDGDGWTLVDTGVDSAESREIWQSLLAGPLAGKPVTRVLATHHHPDHLGLAGWFQARGAALVTSRTAWLTARMLLLDVEERPTEQAVTFWTRAGMDPEILAERRSERPFNFADAVHPMPVGYTRLRAGDSFRAGGRDWDVTSGDGHAPEHLVLWSRDDALVIAGDQLLPSISPNIGVMPSEPDADPLAEWLDSTARFAARARPEQLVLCGHKLPYTGLPTRLRQLSENHESALNRLRQHLETPRTATGCFPVLFKRRIDRGTYGLALVESVAHLNYLYHRGEVARWAGPDGAWHWQLQGKGPDHDQDRGSADQR